MNSVFTLSTLNSSENTGNSGNIKIIIEQAKSGDSRAFGQVYDSFFPKIFKFVYYRVGHKEQAEDLTEDIFIKAHAKISSIATVDAFEGWLYQIARNTIIDYYRQKKSTVPLDEIENTIEYDNNIVDVLNLQDDQKLLLNLMKDLTAEQQQVLKLKFLENIDNATIAHILDKTEGAIRVIQHRAIIKLQISVKNKGLR